MIFNKLVINNGCVISYINIIMIIKFEIQITYNLFIFRLYPMNKVIFCFNKFLLVTLLVYKN